MSEGGQIAARRDSSKYYLRMQSPLSYSDGGPAGLGEKNLTFQKHAWLTTDMWILSTLGAGQTNQEIIWGPRTAYPI